MNRSLRHALHHTLLAGACVAICACENRTDSQTGEFPAAPPASAEPLPPTPLGDLLERSLRDAPAHRESMLQLMEWPLPLSAPDRRHLFAVLAMPVPPERELDEFAELVNESLNLLHRQGEDAAGLSDLLLAMAHDERRPALLRDYALQHLAHVHPLLADAGRRRVEQFIADHGRRAASPLAATALFTLSSIMNPVVTSFGPGNAHTPKPHLDRSVYIALLRSVATDPEALPDTISAALQLLFEQGDREALPQVRALATTPHTPPSLRRTSIGILGRWGDPQSDPALLSKIDIDNRVLQNVVATARQRLASRKP